MAYGPPTTLDPTNVMGRRILAWIIDLIPLIIIAGIFVGGSLKTVNNAPLNFCDQYRAAHSSSSLCFQSNSTAYYSSNFRVSSTVVSLIYWFVVAGLLQGATGATIGKHIVGLRVVDGNGNICGVGKALLRTLIGVFELGFCFLIGLITASVTHPHRRLGDMAAGTFVVAKQSVGTPIAAQMGAAPYPQSWTPPSQGTGWGPPPAGGTQTWPAPAPAGQWPPQATTAPPAGTTPPVWGTPAASPPPAETPTTWGAPAQTPAAAAPGETDAPSTAADDGPGWASPSPSTEPAAEPTPAATTAPQAAAPAPTREPQWDSQRNAWVYWEAETSRWLQFDAATGQWGPLR
jgi:hypothetical protein